MADHVDSAAPGPRERVSPAAMSLADAARVLSRLGGRPITEAMLRADLEAGAPMNADGTLNLVHYTAWLVRDLAQRGGGGGD